MKFTLTLIDWQARAPGLSDADEWQAWSRRSDAIDPDAPLAKLTDLPMMTARRLNSGSKLAVDLGLDDGEVFALHDVDHLDLFLEPLDGRIIEVLDEGNGAFGTDDPSFLDPALVERNKGLT